MLRDIDTKTYERVWKILEETGVQERHFNDLQLRIRSMASLWLLSTFGAIGFLATQDLKMTEVPREILISIVAAAGCIGIALLWVLDLLVYHRLLDSYFIIGLDLEKKYPWLPPIRTNMMKMQKKRGVLFRVVGFYIGPVALLILVSGASLAMCLNQSTSELTVPASLLTVAIAFLATRVMAGMTENTADLKSGLDEGKKPTKCRQVGPRPTP